MKFIIFLIIFYLLSCSYPDIDTVPKFDNLKLTDDELIDLCQLSSADKSKIENCIKTKLNN